jgi:hypothetical protein
MDWLALAAGGPSFTNLKQIWDWLWINWEQQKWNAYCECIPDSGPGPCGPVDYTAPPLTIGLASGSTFAGAAPVPHGSSTVVVTYSLVTATNPDNFYIRLYFKDQLGVDVAPEQNGNQVPVRLGTPQTITWTNLFTQADRDNMRTVEIWARPTGQGSQVGSDMWTIEPRIQIAFTGTCQDVETPVEPPPTPDPPPPPDTPDLPGLPAECTISTVCAMLYELVPIVRNMGQLVNVLQRFGLPFSYQLGNAHIGVTGEGTFAVSGLVGVRIDITGGFPPRQLEGTPPYIWDLGWMTILTAEGMIEEKRITRDTEVWQPLRVQEATTLGYYLKGEVQATITELWPLPY